MKEELLKDAVCECKLPTTYPRNGGYCDDCFLLISQPQRENWEERFEKKLGMFKFSDLDVAQLKALMVCELSTYKQSLRSKIASADIAEDKSGTFQDGYRCFKAQVLALFENKDHTCCDGECNHDDCCGKVPENCPLLDTK